MMQEESKPTQEAAEKEAHKTADLSAWEKENSMIAVMIRMYCHGHHHTKKKEVCPECADLTQYALYRLEKCPFKEKKQFCSSCKIHCYAPDYRAKIKQVMRYSGPRMLFVAPSMVFAHAKQSRAQKKEK